MPNLVNLDVEFVSLVDRAAVRNPTNQSEPQRFLLFKKESGANTDPEGGTMSEAELSAALEKAETERDEASAKVTKAESERDELSAKVSKLEEQVQTLQKADPKPEQINKDELSPLVREALEKAEKRAEDADARIEKAEKLAKAERDERVTRDFVAKAEEIPLVAGDAAEFGPVLKRASESLSKEDFDLLNQRLAAANEQISKSALFKQMGSDADGERGSGDGDLARKAEEIQKSGGSRFDAMREAARGQDGARYLQSVR